VPGIEPGNGGFKGPCLTAWLHPNLLTNFIYYKIKRRKRKVPIYLTFCYNDCMNKEKFLEIYRNPKIRTSFEDSLFFSDPGATLECKKIPLKDFRDFYTPWHQKNGIICGKIEVVLTDPEYRAIKISEVHKYPEKKLFGKLPTEFDTVPLLTDTHTQKTLILDSNHTIAKAIEDVDENFLIDVIEIKSSKASEIVIDFSVINRD
jgi:hypothetical protein